MIKFMVDENNKVSKVEILERKSDYIVVARGNEILGVPIGADVCFFDTEAEACTYSYGGYFVPQGK